MPCLEPEIEREKKGKKSLLEPNCRLECNMVQCGRERPLK